jgi:hypothetical protein
MAYTTAGLTNGGVTTHYRFSYDTALGGPGGVEPARTNAVIAACEADYNLMHGWFGGGLNVTNMTVQVTTGSNGASWNGSPSGSTINLNAQGASYSSNPIYLRYLLIAEVVELFMLAQNNGWFQGSNEGSKGEGLSRFLSGQFLALNNALGLGIDASYAVADLWLNSPRQDFVNNAPDDNGYNATNGCTTLFIYYLSSQLGYSVNQIVGAAASTLAGVFKNLTGNSSDPFPLFKRTLDLWFPSTTGSAVPAPNFDDPFPLAEDAFTGIWRSGTGPYYLWVNADQSHFMSKWQTLSSQNLRLTDIEVTNVNGQNLYSGVWEGGTDGYYLWVDADTPHFQAKWSQLAQQNLRLVSLCHYNGLWAGAWRSGTDGYYLWQDADQSHFMAKWSQLASQNLRLVDFDVYTVNGQQLWAGVWREGSDGYYLWVDADWAHFTAKWAQLASQNLRLVAVCNYNGLWAGAWRSGTDAYYLWANVSQGEFLTKWSQLQGQNLRLIDLEVTAVAGAGGSTGGADSAATGAATAAVFSSEMSGRDAMTRLGPGSVAAAGATGHGGGAGPGRADTAGLVNSVPGTGGGTESVARPAAAIGAATGTVFSSEMSGRDAMTRPGPGSVATAGATGHGGGAVPGSAETADQGLAAGNLGFGGGSHAGETVALTAAPSGQTGRPARPGQGGGS